MNNHFRQVWNKNTSKNENVLHCLFWPIQMHSKPHTLLAFFFEYFSHSYHSVDIIVAGVTTFNFGQFWTFFWQILAIFRHFNFIVQGYLSNQIFHTVILRFTSYFPFYWRCAKTLVTLAQTSCVCSITTTIHKKGSLYTSTSLASMLVYELWAFRVHW